MNFRWSIVQNDQIGEPWPDQHGIIYYGLLSLNHTQVTATELAKRTTDFWMLMERSTIYCQYPVLNRSQWGWKYSNTSGMLEAERNKTWRNHFCWHSICNRRNMSCFIRFPENSTTPHWWISNLNCQTDQCISLVQTKFTRARGSYRNCFRNAKEFWYLVLGRTHHVQSYYDSGTSLKSIATTHSFRRSHMFFLEPILP